MTFYHLDKLHFHVNILHRMVSFKTSRLHGKSGGSGGLRGEIHKAGECLFMLDSHEQTHLTRVTEVAEAATNLVYRPFFGCIVCFVFKDSFRQL